MPMYEVISNDNDYPYSFTTPVPAANPDEARKKFGSIYTNRTIKSIEVIGDEISRKFDKHLVLEE